MALRERRYAPLLAAAEGQVRSSVLSGFVIDPVSIFGDLAWLGGDA
jgi:hypothetical protein